MKTIIISTAPQQNLVKMIAAQRLNLIKKAILKINK